MEKKNVFITNIKNIITGDELADVEGTQVRQEDDRIKSLKQDLNIYALPPIDSQFRKEFEESGMDLVVSRNQDFGELSEIYLFLPFQG